VHDLAAQGFVDPTALRRLVVTTDVTAALDACVAPVPGDGQTAELAEPAGWVDPGDGSRRSLRSWRGG
jgi:hypothetical protein